jgi:hypothetical protein
VDELSRRSRYWTIDRGATVLCDLVQDKIQTGIISLRAKRHLLLAVLGFSAIWINPYGSVLARLAAVSGAAFSRIDEWKPFWREPLLDPTLITGEAVLVLLAFFMWLGNLQRRWAHAVWLLLMSALFLSARRHLWLLRLHALWSWRLTAYAQYSIACATESLARLARRGTHPGDRSTRLWIASAAPPTKSVHRVVAPDLPLASSRFLQSRYAKARVFNDYENSSYLQWRFAGHPPLLLIYLTLIRKPDLRLSRHRSCATARQETSPIEQH